METEAYNMHDETGELSKDLKLEAGRNQNFVDRSVFHVSFGLLTGDDAAKVKWVRLDRDQKLYAGHEKIIQTVIKKHGAYQYDQQFCDTIKKPFHFEFEQICYSIRECFDFRNKLMCRSPMICSSFIMEVRNF